MPVSEKRYLFEYRHEGADWALEIAAESPHDAMQRLKALSWARYKGEVLATIPVPGGDLIAKLARLLRR
jgi:hypothetical protein